jgi:hypothetical protein
MVTQSSAQVYPLAGLSIRGAFTVSWWYTYPSATELAERGCALAWGLASLIAALPRLLPVRTRRAGLGLLRTPGCEKDN